MLNGEAWSFDQFNSGLELAFQWLLVIVCLWLLVFPYLYIEFKLLLTGVFICYGAFCSLHLLKEMKGGTLSNKFNPLPVPSQEPLTFHGRVQEFRKGGSSDLELFSLYINLNFPSKGDLAPIFGSTYATVIFV